jgi:hypothetical protein
MNGKLGLSLIEREFASKVFGDVVLPIILVTKGEGVTAGLGKLLTDTFRDLYSLLYAIRATKYNIVSWAGLVARIGR